MDNPQTIRDLDVVSQEAKKDFAKNRVKDILILNLDLDAEKLTKICIDFFDIYCDINQMVAWNKKSHLDRDFIADARKQWQYYAAFFYHKLSADEDLDCAYTPEELEFLELRMSCLKDETFGLDHDRAVALIGNIIRESMECIRSNFNITALGTDNVIPDLNRYSRSTLEVLDSFTYRILP